MTWSIGIDIGGTTIKAVAVQTDGEMLRKVSRPTNDQQDSLADWVEHAREVIAEFEGETGSPAMAVGLCAPGIADPNHRWISWLPQRLRGIEGFDWTKALERETPVPVVNDAHSAMLGEIWVGSVAGKNNVVLLTLGTGVGGAILSDGKLLNGGIGRAGHFGHLCLDIDGPPSIAGMPGAVEVMIGNATVKDRSQGRFASTRELVAAYEAGNAEAANIWLRSVRALGCAVASIINIIDPEVVVLTGGITTAGNSLMSPLQEVLDEVEWRPGGHQVPVVFGVLDQWAGALGAAYAALHPEVL